MTRKKNGLRQILSKRVYNRLWIIIIFAVTFGLAAIYEVSIGSLGVLYAGGSFLLGLVVGILVSRRHQLKWDPETNQVVSNMDWIGAIIFVLYIIFVIGRSFIVSYWVHGAAYIAVISSIVAGVMIGRLIASRHAMKKIREDLKNVVS